MEAWPSEDGVSTERRSGSSWCNWSNVLPVGSQSAPRAASAAPAAENSFNTSADGRQLLQSPVFYNEALAFHWPPGESLMRRETGASMAGVLVFQRPVRGFVSSETPHRWKKICVSWLNPLLRQRLRPPASVHEAISWTLVCLSGIRRPLKG